jgi:hypothetical protein
MGVDKMLSRFNNQINLHAISEVFNEFINTNKSFKECCLEFNVSNIGEMISSAILNITLNNFCQQKDENFDLTKNDDYAQDSLSAYNFNDVRIMNNHNYSHKQIIKEIRDGIEHISYEIGDDYSSIHINNRRTGFIAEIKINFFFNSFFAHLDASNYNSLLLDDAQIDYKGNVNNAIRNLKIYRLKALNKNVERNSIHFKNRSLNSKTNEFLDESKYERIEKHLDTHQTLLLTKYFRNHVFSKENLSFALPAVQYDDSGFSNEQNRYFVLLFFNLLQKIKDQDIRYKDLLDNNQNNKKMLETMGNYLKMLFITDYYKNTNLVDDETTHIRNCLCHGRFTKIPDVEVILCDHRNGINNEEQTTFIKKYNIDELYYQVEKLSLDYDKKKEK